MALHELAHVDLDQRVLSAEHELGERLGELRLPHTSWTEEEETADRTLRILEAGASATHRTAERADRLLLADHAAAERLLHLQEARRLSLGEAHHRNTGPHRNDCGDLFIGDGGAIIGAIRWLQIWTFSGNGAAHRWRGSWSTARCVSGAPKCPRCGINDRRWKSSRRSVTTHRSVRARGRSSARSRHRGSWGS